MAYATRTSAPRRKRYVVTYLKNGERATIDIRAYSEQSARETAIRHGIQPLSLRLYRKGERVVIAPDAGWRLNALDFRTLQREMGLTWPVQIRKSGRKGGRNGSYKPAPGPVHQIMVKDYLNPAQAAETLRHELAHAMQAERISARVGALPNDPRFIRAWNETDKGVGYINKSREVEARAYEQRNLHLTITR